FANMAQAIAAPGDVVLVPNPTYPIHAFGFIIAGAVIRHLPASNGDDFLRAIEHAVQHSIPKPLAVVMSFPSNPTAMTVGLDFYKEAVALAKKLDIIILSDIAYSELYFDGNPPPSILQVPGAKDIAVEFTSLSKTYNMPGWRMGFAVGNERLIGALARVKSYLDYGAFTPIQVAAAAALNGPQECVDEIRAMYKSRRDALVESFGRAGFPIPSPPATMFAWAPVPERFRHLSSVAFAKPHARSRNFFPTRHSLRRQCPAPRNPPVNNHRPHGTPQTRYRRTWYGWRRPVGTSDGQRRP